MGNKTFVMHMAINLQEKMPVQSKKQIQISVKAKVKV